MEKYSKLTGEEKEWIKKHFKDFCRKCSRKNYKEGECPIYLVKEEHKWSSCWHPKPKELKKEDLLKLHEIIVKETGGAEGLINEGGLDFVVSKINSSRNPDVFHRAALLMEALISSHPFVDGNKRIGLMAASLYLEDHGILLEAEVDELVDFVFSISKGEETVSSIGDWLAQHSAITEEKAGILKRIKDRKQALKKLA